jgi:hypothetical protein
MADAVEDQRFSLRGSNAVRVGLGGLVALFAVEDLAELGDSAGFGLRPRAILPGRVMAHMLGVSAGKVGDPVVFFVLMEGYDLLMHNLRETKEQPQSRIPFVIPYFKITASLCHG